MLWPYFKRHTSPLPLPEAQGDYSAIFDRTWSGSCKCGDPLRQGLPELLTFKLVDV